MMPTASVRLSLQRNWSRWSQMAFVVAKPQCRSSSHGELRIKCFVHPCYHCSCLTFFYNKYELNIGKEQCGIQQIYIKLYC